VKRPRDVPGEYPLYKTDAEIAELVGVGLDRWRANAIVLTKSGLPARDLMFANKRYWPAVRAFLDRRNGVGQQSATAGFAPDGEEHWD
jgi:hypothetical protein